MPKAMIRNVVWSKEYEDKGKKLPEKIYLPLEEPVFFGDNADVHKAKWYSATERIKKTRS